MREARSPSEQPSPVPGWSLPGPSPSLRLPYQCLSPGQAFQGSFLPEPRHKKDQCVPSRVVQWKPHPMGRRETWAIIQGLLLTDDLRRVPFPSRASVSWSEK